MKTKQYDYRGKKIERSIGGRYEVRHILFDNHPYHDRYSFKTLAAAKGYIDRDIASGTNERTASNERRAL